MSLRTRVALLVAGVVTVIVVVVGFNAVRAAGDELRQEIDDDLTQRAAVIGRSDELRTGFRRPTAGPEGRVPPRQDLFRLFVSFDALARIVDSDGEVLLTLDRSFDAPTDPTFLDSVRDSSPVLTTLDEADESFRVLTVQAGPDVFVQLARSLAEVDDAITDLRRRVVFVGALAVAAAALAAWSLARGALQPISRLTDAAEHVAATGDLSLAVEDSGPTEVGRLAASFRTMLGALATSRRQQHELVMNASHELRTPLTSLRTNVDVLHRMDRLSDDDRAALLEDLDSELGELTDLVTELVDLATEVRVDEAVEPLHLDDLVRGVIDREQRRTGRDVELMVDRRVLVEGRPEALTRAIRNLVSNATKFTDDGPIRIMVDAGRVAVHDAGPGIPETERSRVFDRFHRLESPGSRPGSGLGLAIVAQVTEAHGGTVFVEDSPLGGAAIGFVIPTVDD